MNREPFPKGQLRFGVLDLGRNTPCTCGFCGASFTSQSKTPGVRCCGSEACKAKQKAHKNRITYQSMKRRKQRAA